MNEVCRPPAHQDLVQLEHSSDILRAHPATECAGEVCTLHNRTDHIMRSFPQVWRDDRKVMERMCPHGVGHPDPDDFAIVSGADRGIHGCDGCCTRG